MSAKVTSDAPAAAAAVAAPAESAAPAEAPRKANCETAFGCPRDFLGHRFVYAVVSPRARGLSIGLNLNPDKYCNFECVYCEVDRKKPSVDKELDVAVMATELDHLLFLAHSGEIRKLAPYNNLGVDLLRLRHVALSGDGEPTLSPKFSEAVYAVTHIRARKTHPYFKLALITNGTGLDLPVVQEGLRYFTREDDIWIKLDAGTQGYMDKVNRSEAPLEKVLENIRLVGRKRPVIIQSLFPSIGGAEPGQEELDQYVARLRELKESGAVISLVQVYSATRPHRFPECGHLPLKSLVRICTRIKTETGLKAEIF